MPLPIDFKPLHIFIWNQSIELGKSKISRKHEWCGSHSVSIGCWYWLRRPSGCVIERPLSRSLRKWYESGFRCSQHGQNFAGVYNYFLERISFMHAMARNRLYKWMKEIESTKGVVPTIDNLAGQVKKMYNVWGRASQSNGGTADFTSCKRVEAYKDKSWAWSVGKSDDVPSVTQPSVIFRFGKNLKTRLMYRHFDNSHETCR
jgi:hypothetical protein